MCGRIARGNAPGYYIEKVAPGAMAEEIFRQPDLFAGYNISPQQTLLVCRSVPDAGARWCYLRWGLLPPWAKDPAERGFSNARAETVTERRSFQRAFRQHRCLVPVDGYYEWQALPEGPKQPYFIQCATSEPLVLAGIWESWRRELDTVAVLTTAAGGALQAIHHRMPVILDPIDIDVWLHGAPEEAQRLLSASDLSSLRVHPVSRAVNNPRNNTPSLLDPLSEQ